MATHVNEGGTGILKVDLNVRCPNPWSRNISGNSWLSALRLSTETVLTKIQISLNSSLSDQYAFDDDGHLAVTHRSKGGLKRRKLLDPCQLTADNKIDIRVNFRFPSMHEHRLESGNPSGSGRTTVADRFLIRQAEATSKVVEGLVNVLMDCVEGGASVSFMAPLTRERATAFWRRVFDEAERGERFVLIAEDSRTGQIIGTVQLILAMPENQPHRAEVVKMLVHRNARRQGLGAALMQAIEAAARSAGRTLLVLDTASNEAMRLYERLGWCRCGSIPNFALSPHGGLCDTTLYYRELSTAETSLESA